MKPSPESPRHGEEIEAQASQWVLRCDRGLTAGEQDEFSSWLAKNPQHRDALAEQRWGWDELDRLVGVQATVGAQPDPDLLAPKRAPRAAIVRQMWRWIPAVLASAAVIAIVGWIRIGKSRGSDIAQAHSEVSRAILAAPCERRTLDDGTIVELNRGAAIEVGFSATERTVRLVRGEANFLVANDPSRPFVVKADGVGVRAIGTVFNVRLETMAVEVVVTEGKVQVETPVASVAAPRTEPTLLEKSQRAIIPLQTVATPVVATLTATQLQAHLAWQPRLLDFTDATLPEIVAEFNRRNPVKLVIADPALDGVRLSAAFRSDNVEGFVRLMETDFGMRTEWRGERELALFRAK